jgi:hypothetical protein
MALPPLASRSQLEEHLERTLNGAQAARAEAVLHQVSALVRSAAGGRRTPWPDGTAPDAVVAVVLAVAKRVFENPHNVKASTTGPFGATYALVGLYLEDAERRIVRRAAGRRQGGLRSIPVTRGECRNDSTVYVPTDRGGAGFPWYVADDPTVPGL